jgi:hypothetical protein
MFRRGLLKRIFNAAKVAFTIAIDYENLANREADWAFGRCLGHPLKR